MLTFLRTDENFRKGFIRIWYRNQYGQDRYIELPYHITESNSFGKTVIDEFNRVLASQHE